MSPQQRTFELTISTLSGKDLEQLKKITLPMNLILEYLEKFLSDRVDARSVNDALSIIQTLDDPDGFWVGNYLVNLTEIILTAKGMYTPRNFKREL